MKYKAYPKYKDSGIEWLGKIPEEWEAKKLKFLISQKITDGPHETPEFIDEGVPFLSVDGIQDDKLIFEGCRYISKRDHDQYKSKCSPQKNDILLGKAASVGKVAIVDVDFEFNIWSPLALIRANKKILPRYIYYSLKSDFLQDQVYILSTSNTQHNLSMDDIPKLWFATPNVKYQQKIISFLDGKTAKIDKLVRNNKKQIELLKERRQAIISQAVTKGLNPKVKMRDSGIDWLGEIPEEWELKRLRFLCRLNPPKSECKENINIGVTFLSMDMVSKRGEINEGETRTMKDVYEGYTYFRDNDVLLAKITPCFENGKGALVRNLLNGIGFGTTEFHVLRVYKSISPEYLYFITYSTPFRKIGQANMIGAAGQKRIPENFVKDFTIGIPSIKEQNRIVLGLKSKLADIELLMGKLQLQNQKLQEFRQSLISNVVTGKIKIG